MIGWMDRILRRYTPDPFVFAIALTFLVLVMGVSVTSHTLKEMVIFWGEGFWKLSTFTLQMVMVLVGGYSVATAPLFRKLLASLASLFRTPGQAILATTLVSLTASWLNWGFGLVIGALFCREIYRVIPRANYRLLVASAYSGFLVWHGGLSGSIPLGIATPGNFAEKLIGRTLPVSETLFSSLNLVAVGSFFVLLPLINYWMGTQSKSDHRSLAKLDEFESSDANLGPSQTPAEKIESSKALAWSVGCLGLGYFIIEIARGSFKLDLDRVNFIFFFLALALHGSLRGFISAMTHGAKKAAPILIQFPFYSGMMSMMTASGLAIWISQLFVSVSSPATFPLYTFYSAGLVNLFIPSGGGQWAVQGPVILPAAQALGADLGKASMAVAWGDAWTNLLQPFWALPLLGVAGLHLRDIMGYCVSILVMSGIVLSLVFYFA